MKPSLRHCSVTQLGSRQRHTRCRCVFGAQGKGGVHLAGAWCGYGFHEDGLSAGMAAAEALGARIPWTPRSACPKISLTDSFFMRVFHGFANAALKIGRLRIILPNGEELVYGERSASSAIECSGRVTGTARVISTHAKYLCMPCRAEIAWSHVV